MVQLVESIILKSEYLFEIFQSPEIVKFIGMSPHSDDDKEVTNILSQCINLYQNKYWSEIDTKILNRTFTETAFRYTPGTKFIPSKLIENLLGIVLTQAMDIVNNSTIIDFENIIEVKLLIKARIFSILNNLISRFKVGTGTALLINRQDNPRSLSHDFLIEYFNSLNLTKFLMSCFDIEINAQGIFFGTREAGSYENVFGLENKSFVNEVKYDAFQTFIIESIRCFGTVCDLIIDYVRDTRIAASRLGFVIELSLHLLSPEDFYRNIFNNFSNEYSANFFVMFMILSDFNREKGLEKYSRNKIHTYHLAISTLSNPALFNSDNTFDYQGMFASKINQGFILSSGKTEQILRANSVSTASLQAMYSVLRLWRKANRASKPVLADLLTGSQLSPHFSNQVFPWVVFSDLAAQGADPPHERHHLQLVRGAPRHEVHRRVPHLAADLLQRARQVLHRVQRRQEEGERPGQPAAVDGHRPRGDAHHQDLRGVLLLRVPVPGHAARLQPLSAAQHPPRNRLASSLLCSPEAVEPAGGHHRPAEGLHRERDRGGTRHGDQQAGQLRALRAQGPRHRRKPHAHPVHHRPGVQLLLLARLGTRPLLSS